MPKKDPSINNKPLTGTSVNTATEKIIGLFIMTAGFLMGVAFVAALIPVKQGYLPTSIPASIPSSGSEALDDWSNIHITSENTSVAFVDQCLGQAYPSLYDPDELIVDTDILDIDWNLILTNAVKNSSLTAKLQNAILNNNIFKSLGTSPTLNSLSDSADNCDVNYLNDTHCQEIIDQQINPPLAEQFCLSLESREQVKKITNSDDFNCSIEDVKKFLTSEYAAAGYQEEIVNQLTKIPGVNEEVAQKIANQVAEQIVNLINSSSETTLQWSCYLNYTANCPEGYSCNTGKSNTKNKYTGDYVWGGYCDKNQIQVKLPTLPDLQIPTKDDIKSTLDLSGKMRALLAAAGDINRDGSEIAAIKTELAALLAGLPLEKKDLPEINISQSIADLMTTIDKALTEKKMTPEEKAMKKAQIITAIFETVQKTRQTFNVLTQSLNVADNIKKTLVTLFDKMITAASSIDKEQAKQTLISYINSVKGLPQEQKDKLIEYVKDSDAYNNIRIPDPIKEELVKQIQENIANQSYRNEILTLIEQLHTANKSERAQIKSQIISKVTITVTNKTVRTAILNQVERLVTALQSIDYATMIANLYLLIDNSNLPDKETVKNNLSAAVTTARETIRTMRHSSNVGLKDLEDKVSAMLKNIYENKPVQTELNEIKTTLNSYQLTPEERQALITAIETAVANAEQQAKIIKTTLQNVELSGVYRSKIGYALSIAIEKASTVLSDVDAAAKIQEIRSIIASYELSGHYQTAATGLAQATVSLVKNYDYGAKINMATEFINTLATEVQNRVSTYQSSCVRNTADANYNISTYGWLEYYHDNYVKVKNPDYCTFDAGTNKAAVWQASCELGYTGTPCPGACANGICN